MTKKKVVLSGLPKLAAAIRDAKKHQRLITEQFYSYDNEGKFVGCLMTATAIELNGSNPLDGQPNIKPETVIDWIQNVIRKQTSVDIMQYDTESDTGGFSLFYHIGRAFDRGRTVEEIAHFVENFTGKEDIDWIYR